MPKYLRPSSWWRYDRWRERRHLIFGATIALLFGLLEARLFYLQIVQGGRYSQKAQENYLKAEIIPPPRGKMFDRKGRVMVDNYPIYSLYGIPYLLKRKPSTITLLSQFIPVDETTLRNRVLRTGGGSYQPVLLLRELDYEQMATLSLWSIDLPGVYYDKEIARSYPVKGIAHLVGTIGEPSNNSVEGYGFFPGMMVGKSGLEKQYQDYLFGQVGIRYVEVDARGQRLGTSLHFPPQAPQSGWDLHLNIDARLQEYARELMGDYGGAVVALDPRNGAVLALLSLPDYDPHLFSGKVPWEVWERFQNDPNRPLLNRAIQGLYPPGSTFKMVVLAAALEEGIVDDYFSVHCSGGINIGNRFFRCWKKGGHGTLNWEGGLQHSCDVFFYTLGLRLGVDRIAHYARLLGLGKKTGIDLPNEAPGVIPTVQYLKKRWGGWAGGGGSAANIAIGQGEVLVTPVQLAVYTAAIATGLVVRPRLVEYLQSPITGEKREVVGEIWPVKISPQTLRKVREGMRRVVNEPGGTAYLQKRSDIVIAGKTGTAQNPHGDDHALFVAYAPVDDPLIVCVAVVEHGKHGSSGAAPIVCKLIDYYLYDLFPGPRIDRFAFGVESPPSPPSPDNEVDE